MDRLATQFDCGIEEAVGLILSLPDGDYKQDMLHVRSSLVLINHITFSKGELSFILSRACSISWEN